MSTLMTVVRLPDKAYAADFPVPGHEHVYVLHKDSRQRPTRAVYSKTHLPATKLGTIWDLVDMDGTKLGTYTIVGIGHYDTGYSVGDLVPGYKLATARVI